MNQIKTTRCSDSSKTKQTDNCKC